MIIPDTNKSDFKKAELEQLEQEKQVFKLIDTIIRTKGLNLYAYNSTKDTIFKILIDYKDTCYTKIKDKKLIINHGKNYSKSNIDPRNEHFEALNMSSAKKRVEKFKNGRIKELCNLRSLKDQDTKLKLNYF